MSNSETSAAHLARLKVTFPLWNIARHHIEPGSGPPTVYYTATRPGGVSLLQEPTLDRLEGKLIEADGRWAK
jgi:hypothetical protein